MTKMATGHQRTTAREEEARALAEDLACLFQDMKGNEAMGSSPGPALEYNLELGRQNYSPSIPSPPPPPSRLAATQFQFPSPIRGDTPSPQGKQKRPPKEGSRSRPRTKEEDKSRGRERRAEGRHDTAFNRGRRSSPPTSPRRTTHDAHPRTREARRTPQRRTSRNRGPPEGRHNTERRRRDRGRRNAARAASPRRRGPSRERRRGRGSPSDRRHRGWEAARTPPRRHRGTRRAVSPRRAGSSTTAPHLPSLLALPINPPSQLRNEMASILPLLAMGNWEFRITSFPQPAASGRAGRSLPALMEVQSHPTRPATTRGTCRHCGCHQANT